MSFGDFKIVLDDVVTEDDDDKTDDWLDVTSVTLCRGECLRKKPLSGVSKWTSTAWLKENVNMRPKKIVKKSKKK